ncbi:hypothetical protein QBC37DRAFT_478101 [Rhypophila decipiens]|uniref:Alternative oxidase n=1 Tax=Rhypophila decipiens TaxID=261697 RepID=A0AAN6YH22_9PEZI|nr:hypothetical protein QBC37DRAFT_478101 [Rhypophila decipiens]
MASNCRFKGTFKAPAVQQPYSPRYEPLGQDSLSTDKRTPRRFGLVPSLCRVLACIAAALSVCLLFAVYSRGSAVGSSLSATFTVKIATTTFLSTSGADRATTISKHDFIAAVLRDPVEGLVDLGPIQKKCNEIKFQEGLIWQCAPVNGGIGNVVNMVLNCVRYALEAGATTLVLSRIQIRGDNLIDLGNKDHTAEMSYLLDADYFVESWKLACPQMRALVSETDDPDYYNATTSILPKAVLSPERVKNFERRKYLIVDPTGWREAFDAWMFKYLDISGGNRSITTPPTPVRVWQNLAMYQWNRLAHAPEFANSFPRLFRQLPAARRLAASALYNLGRKMNHSSVSDNILFLPTTTEKEEEFPSNTSIVNSLGPGRLASNGFLGAHLRVAADAVAAGWPGYEAQAPLYIREAKERNLSSVYLATGSAEHRDRFWKEAALEGLVTFTKEDLLDAEEREELARMSWDQQALVDFEVLMHSAMFYGFVRSSFSWALAMRRGTLPEAAGTAVYSEGEHEYRDGLSAIVGRHENMNPEGIWT